MRTQSVATQTTELLTSSKTNKSGSVKQKDISEGFGNVMAKTNGKSNTVQDVNNKKTESKKDEPSDTIFQRQASQSVESSRAAKSKTTVNDENRTTISEELQSKFEKVLEDLETTVTSTLDISKEEFDEIMAILGLTVQDLFQPDNLKQLVLKVNGSDDITAVLTDENLGNQLQNLLQKLDELKSGQTFDLTDEELDFLLKNYQVTDETESSKTFELSDKNQDFVLEESENTDNLLQDNVEEMKKTTEFMSQKDMEIGSNNENEIPLEVHKLTDTDVTDSNPGKDSATDKNSELDMPTPFELIMNHLTDAVTDNFSDIVANSRQIQEITNQIIEQIKVIIKPDQTSMELQLHPEHLGKISLAVSEKDGVLTAHFTTQTQIAKEAIESQMQYLKENLNNQGLKVETIEVTVSDYNFQQSDQAASGKEEQSNQQKRHIFKDDMELFNPTSELETIASDSMDYSGNQIDYTA